MTAIDPECGNNGPVRYRLAPGMLSPLQEFRVDSSTGEVCVSDRLDYELTTGYQFQIEATDQGKSLTLVCFRGNQTDPKEQARPKMHSLPVDYI